MTQYVGMETPRHYFRRAYISKNKILMSTGENSAWANNCEVILQAQQNYRNLEHSNFQQLTNLQFRKTSTNPSNNFLFSQP